MTFFYSNQQSARLMFYHDHAFGITRLNVYAGEAAGYLLQDPVEQGLVASGIIPPEQIPLIIQDKTFVPDDTQPLHQPHGDLRFPARSSGSHLGRLELGRFRRPLVLRTFTCPSRIRQTWPGWRPWAGGITAPSSIRLTYRPIRPSPIPTTTRSTRLGSRRRSPGPPTRPSRPRASWTLRLLTARLIPTSPCSRKLIASVS